MAARGKPSVVGIGVSNVSGSASSAENVMVTARFRPLNSKEISMGGRGVISHVTSTDVQLTGGDGHGGDRGGDRDRAFTFDRVFDTQTTQETIYTVVGKPLIRAFMGGYNACLLAYGQTGSGKTHTMMGPDALIDKLCNAAAGDSRMDDEDLADVDNLAGIVPRAIQDIFDTIEKSDEALSYTMEASMVEIYLEKVRDLLDASPAKANLNIVNGPDGSPLVLGATCRPIATIQELFLLMRSGTAARVTAITSMNAQSSRSHSIFTIRLTTDDVRDGSRKCSVLHLCDLAGSEAVGKTGVTGTQLAEAGKINSSLSMLGIVINKLTDPKAKNEHIPYTSSKLTKLLSNSLGGNAKTALVLACSPSEYNSTETLSSLRFGQRAKSIKQVAVINVERTAEELKRYCASLELRYREAASVVRLVLDAGLLSQHHPRRKAGAATAAATAVGSPGSTERTNMVLLLLDRAKTVLVHAGPDLDGFDSQSPSLKHDSSGVSPGANTHHRSRSRSGGGGGGMITVKKERPDSEDAKPISISMATPSNGRTGERRGGGGIEGDLSELERTHLSDAATSDDNDVESSSSSSSSASGDDDSDASSDTEPDDLVTALKALHTERAAKETVISLLGDAAKEIKRLRIENETLGATPMSAGDRSSPVDGTVDANIDAEAGAEASIKAAYSSVEVIALRSELAERDSLLATMQARLDMAAVASDEVTNKPVIRSHASAAADDDGMGGGLGVGLIGGGAGASASPSPAANAERKGFFSSIMRHFGSPRKDRGEMLGNAAESQNNENSPGVAQDNAATAAHQTFAAFFVACERGDVAAVRREFALQQHNASQLITATDRSGRTGLLYAARGGSMNVVEALVAAGTDVFVIDKDARSALAYASRRGHTELGRWLLAKGLAAAQCDVHGLTPLHQAVLAKSPAMAEALLEAGADVVARDSNGLTPYRLAKRFLSSDSSASKAVLIVLQNHIKTLCREEQLAAGMSQTSVDANFSTQMMVAGSEGGLA